ncbi:MAG: T9SS C-terminal target domain-containing protein [Ignavibacteriales bacterium]|nr:MAG: T9SS C-terminal target domain-containing protein [Ignavibacteriales bacterium]
MMKRLLFILLLYYSSMFAQGITINEVMPSNLSFLQDEDGDYSDWIELYNASSQPITLSNHFISDDKNDLQKWSFPGISIKPHETYLLFASDKNKRAFYHYETVADWGDDWKYFAGNTAPPAEWATLDFNDALWSVGSSGFGYGDNDDSTFVGSPNILQPSPVTCYIRREFYVEDVNEVMKAFLHIDYNDGFVAYVNDVEISRSNMQQKSSRPVYNELALEMHDALMINGQQPEEFIIENIKSVLRNGRNIIAIEVHNEDLFSTNLTLIPFFTLEMTKAPDQSLGTSSYLTFPVYELHTNFKLKAGGESIYLSNINGEIIDSVEFKSVPDDVSYGRKPGTGNEWFYFFEPTPNAENLTSGSVMNNGEVNFSVTSGKFNQSFQLTLEPTIAGQNIYYTLDGSEPTESSFVYQSPILVDSVTVVRARTLAAGMLPGKISTHTYFVNNTFELPVISLTTDPVNLWSEEKGIYILGPNADMSDYPYWGANFWQDWERPVNIEYFNTSGESEFQIDGTTKIYGSWSRLYPQKSLAIYTSDENIKYRLFPDKNINEFNNFVMRNSGQDWGRTFFRDAMIHSLAKDIGIDMQAYNPVLTYFNGEFFGIFNLREKINEWYIRDNYGIDPDNIDMIERDTTIIHGDAADYSELINFLRTQDITKAENYEYVKSRMDVHNYMDYMILEFFLANSDWPWNNVKIWRQKNPATKWRWIIYDTDYGFNGGHLGPDADMFSEISYQDVHTTFLFFKLLENPEYKREFINRTADLLNTILSEEYTANRINEFKERLEPAMPKHIARWKGTFNEVWWLGKSIDSMQEWYDNINIALNFAVKRQAFMRQQLTDKFGLKNGYGTIYLNAAAEEGRIKINTITPQSYPWSGKYFFANSVTVSAVPNPGYRFVKWIGLSPEDSSTVTFRFSDNQNITAIFEKTGDYSGDIVVNEINYNSVNTFDTKDWVEIYNSTGNEIDLIGWKFFDSEDTHSFEIPAGTKIHADGYLVLCEDTTAFKSLFPDVKNYVGNIGFGLSGSGELLRIYNKENVLIDSLTYDDNAPWPTEPDGKGKTLSLKNPKLENSDGSSWLASLGNGTPGSVNDIYTSVESDDEKSIPLTFGLKQNYPNPFNPITKIKYSIPHVETGYSAAGGPSLQTTLIVYDVLGREIATLVNEEKHSGEYEVEFSAEQFSSGIYFYQLKYGDQIQTKKMMLLK